VVGGIIAGGILAGIVESIVASHTNGASEPQIASAPQAAASLPQVIDDPAPENAQPLVPPVFHMPEPTGERAPKPPVPPIAPPPPKLHRHPIPNTRLQLWDFDVRPPPPLLVWDYDPPPPHFDWWALLVENAWAIALAFVSLLALIGAVAYARLWNHWFGPHAVYRIRMVVDAGEQSCRMSRRHVHLPSVDVRFASQQWEAHVVGRSQRAGREGGHGRHPRHA